MELKINWDLSRSKHAIERMILRGLSQKEVKDAIIKGKKRKKNNGVVEAFIRYYSIVYEEKIYKKQKVRKIFPITTKLW
jgi:hypothetical protein